MYQKMEMGEWICKVTGNTEFIGSISICGCLTPVKIRLYFLSDLYVIL